ncbi:MAG: nucleoside/nucleotide kinase family protein [Marivivens sp.]|nr:nucleoside/nucleotide kinase family protein [Marivivens sp.]
MLQPELFRSAEFADLIKKILALPRTDGRLMVAVSGAPASGKSTLAEFIANSLSAAGRQARYVPMDGFHLDNRILDARGLRARKGAPETFDADGFVALMRRMKLGGDVVYPMFDRSRDLAVAGAGIIEESTDIAVVEGNYVLQSEAPWSELADVWDLSVYLDVPEETLRQRCIQRWLDHDHTPEAARLRAEGNDMVNAKRVIENRLAADVTIRSDAVPAS